MKNTKLVLLFALISFSINQMFSQDLPLIYENDFELTGAILDFEFTDKNAWGIEKIESNQVLSLHSASKYSPEFRSPLNISVLRLFELEDFAFEIDVQQTGREYGHRDLCFFLGMKDPNNYYYIHIASQKDDHAHSIFIVNDEARKSIASFRTDGIKWNQGRHKIRIERTVESGLIRVFFDDMGKAIMEAEDHHFNSGYIGFGSFDDVGNYDNLKVWGKIKKGNKEFLRD